jgi:hypothetical protein
LLLNHSVVDNGNLRSAISYVYDKIHLLLLQVFIIVAMPPQQRLTYVASPPPRLPSISF